MFETEPVFPRAETAEIAEQAAVVFAPRTTQSVFV